MAITGTRINALRQIVKSHLDDLEAEHSGDDITAFHALLAQADAALAAIMDRLGLGGVQPLDGEPKPPG